MGASKSAAERAARIELAGAYRLAAHYGWEYLIYNHIALRVPGESSFLVKPHSLCFSEVRASDLIKLGLDGKPATFEEDVNTAGFVIHTAILNARPDIHCTLHVHTAVGIAFAALKRELLPLNQNAMRFYKRLSYHDFEGFATELDEARTLASDLGPSNTAMVLRNHGLLTCGEGAAEAVSTMLALLLCCEAQLLVHGSGAEYELPPPAICEHSAAQNTAIRRQVAAQERAAFDRLLDRIDPSYKL
ncbi:MAG TPA: class II aldolase/adducin family protein [Ramlibacter sp.]|uniref:class II aldolase/adducin family protein n=1 Tax=Ramlibacter sp. TaxID=1917967 RepID=UPI002C392CD3|nr:class II aldolase/adducin family protein [Ramlibacter sp.]HVZ46537.1 class II aldolase/adducin family protein [Ramlibacter sp.]